MALKQAKVFLITSVKGGTGKTTTALNLAGMFQKRNLETLIIDLDVYGGSVAASLNLEYKSDLFDAMDDLNNNRFSSLDSYIVNYTTKLDVLPAPKDPRLAGKISSKFLHVILAKAKLKYDVIKQTPPFLFFRLIASIKTPCYCGSVVEHRIGNAAVAGPIPASSSNNKKTSTCCLFFYLVIT